MVGSMVAGMVDVSSVGYLTIHTQRDTNLRPRSRCSVPTILQSLATAHSGIQEEGLCMDHRDVWVRMCKKSEVGKEERRKRRRERISSSNRGVFARVGISIERGQSMYVFG
jgi:hypothetical protein